MRGGGGGASCYSLSLYLSLSLSLALFHVARPFILRCRSSKIDQSNHIPSEMEHPLLHAAVGIYLTVAAVLFTNKLRSLYLGIWRI